MDCKHSYKNIPNGYLYCNINNSICPLMKYCHMTENYKSIDNYETSCKYYINEEERKIMNQGDNKIRFVKDNLLYIEVDNQVIRINNPFKENIPKYVDIVKIDDFYYIKGFEPKVEYKTTNVVSKPKRSRKIKDKPTT